MSKYTMHTLKCPHCGNVFKRKVADSINVTIEPDTLKKVMTGDIFELSCKSCKKKFNYNHPVLYHNMDKSFMIQYASNPRELVRFIELTKTFRENVKKDFDDFLVKTYRVIPGNDSEFIEKIGVLTYGFNDVAAEIYKQAFYEGKELKDVSNITYVFNDDCSECKLKVSYSDPNKNDELYDIDDELMHSIEEDIKDFDLLDREDEFIVNRELTLAILDNPLDVPFIHEEYIKEFEKREIKDKNDFAVKLAKSGMHDKAIKLLLECTSSPDARNDLGVVYELTKDYKSALEWYIKAGNENGYKNALQLFDNKRLEYTKEEYLELCNKLIDMKSQYGYLYASYIYRDGIKMESDNNKAFNTLLEGLVVCSPKYRIVFELGYLLSMGYGCEKDYYKSHKCYESVLEFDDYVIQNFAQYNYGMQCLNGEGCEVDIPKAIKHLEISAGRSNVHAINKLIEIYSSDEYRDEEKLKYYTSLQ